MKDELSQDATITLRQLYLLFGKLGVRSRCYSDLPFESDGIVVNHSKFFNVLQKEIHAHSMVYMN